MILQKVVWKEIFRGLYTQTESDKRQKGVLLICSHVYFEDHHDLDELAKLVGFNATLTITEHNKRRGNIVQGVGDISLTKPHHEHYNNLVARGAKKYARKRRRALPDALVFCTHSMPIDSNALIDSEVRNIVREAATDLGIKKVFFLNPSRQDSTHHQDRN